MAKQTEEEKNLLELFRSTDETNVELALQMYEGLRQAGEKLKSVKKFLCVFDGNVGDIVAYNKNRKEAFDFIHNVEINNFDRNYMGIFNYWLEYRPVNNYAKKHYEFIFDIKDFATKTPYFFVEEFVEEIREFFKDAIFFEHKTDIDIIHEMIVFKFMLCFKLR